MKSWHANALQMSPTASDPYGTSRAYQIKKKSVNFVNE